MCRGQPHTDVWFPLLKTHICVFNLLRPLAEDKLNCMWLQSTESGLNQFHEDTQVPRCRLLHLGHHVFVVLSVISSSSLSSSSLRCVVGLSEGSAVILARSRWNRTFPRGRLWSADSPTLISVYKESKLNTSTQSRWLSERSAFMTFMWWFCYK